MISKEIILETCKQLILQRISAAEQAMKAAQEGSNSEDKSSAGDKYETSRAMGQLDRDMNAKQLVQAQQELRELMKLDIKPSKIVKNGSLINTNAGTYFIAVGLGNVQIAGTSIIILSPKSPLAIILLGKTKGEQIPFNGREIMIAALS